MIFTYDPPKRALNIANHGFDLADAGSCDWTNALITPSYGVRLGSARFKAVLPFEGELVAVVFQRLGIEALSVISMRRASRRET